MIERMTSDQTPRSPQWSQLSESADRAGEALRKLSKAVLEGLKPSSFMQVISHRTLFASE